MIPIPVAVAPRLLPLPETGHVEVVGNGARILCLCGIPRAHPGRTAAHGPLLGLYRDHDAGD